MPIIKQSAQGPRGKMRKSEPVARSAEYVEDSDDFDDAPPSKADSNGKTRVSKPALPSASQTMSPAGINLAKPKLKPTERLIPIGDRLGSSTTESKDKRNQSLSEDSSEHTSSSDSDSSPVRGQPVKADPASHVGPPSLTSKSPAPPTAKGKAFSQKLKAAVSATDASNISSGSFIDGKAGKRKSEVEGTFVEEGEGNEGGANHTRRQTSSEIGSEEESDDGRDEMSLDQDSVPPESTVTSKQIPLPAYIPPSQYGPATISFALDSGLNNLFAPAHLSGKQVWHISAPASVPLSSVKEVAAKSVVDGSIVISHDGADYGFVPDSEDAAGVGSSLLLASLSDNAYIASPVTISKTLQLQQQSKLPIHSQGTQFSAHRSSQPSHHSSKARIQQPPGLKMRDHAFGVPGATLSGSDSEAESQQESEKPVRSNFVQPASSKPTSPSRKRKHKEFSGKPFTPQASETRVKKLKTTSNDIHASISPVDATSILSNSITQALPTAGQVNADRETRNHPMHLNGNTPATRSKEDRAKRKAEKQQNKLRDPFKEAGSVVVDKGMKVGQGETAKVTVNSDVVMREPDKDPATETKQDAHSPDHTIPVSLASIEEAKMEGVFPDAKMHVREPSPGGNISLLAAKRDAEAEKKLRKEEKRRKKKEQRNASLKDDLQAGAGQNITTVVAMKSQEALNSHDTPSDFATLPENTSPNDLPPVKAEPFADALDLEEAKRRRKAEKRGRMKKSAELHNATNITNAQVSHNQPFPTFPMQSTLPESTNGIYPDAAMKVRPPFPVKDGPPSVKVTDAKRRRLDPSNTSSPPSRPKTSSLPADTKKPSPAATQEPAGVRPDAGMKVRSPHPAKDGPVSTELEEKRKRKEMRARKREEKAQRRESKAAGGSK